MSEEEIKEALEIIKQPITVNRVEYKYFDQENYDKLISVYENCLWIVNLFEQAKEHIEPIQQENTQLKEAIKRCYTPEEIDFEIMPVKAELEAEKDINNNLHKTIDKLRVNLYETQQENAQLKSVLKEIREYIDEFIIYVDEDGEIYFKEEFSTEYNDLLEIIDKGIGANK